MTQAMDIMGLGGIMRQAIHLVRSVQIKQDQQQFELAVFSVIPWFKVSCQDTNSPAADDSGALQSCCPASTCALRSAV